MSAELSCQNKHFCYFQSRHKCSFYSPQRSPGHLKKFGNEFHDQQLTLSELICIKCTNQQQLNHIFLACGERDEASTQD